MVKKLPVYITWFRVILVPVLVIAFYSGLDYANWLTFYVFVFASVSDFLDGWLARTFDSISEFGSFFDPVADKLMVCVCMILLSIQHESVWMTTACTIIVGREIVVSALREWNAKQGLSSQSSVSIWGKLKTIFQCLAIGFLLVGEQVGIINTVFIGNTLLVPAVILTLTSMIHYFYLTYKESTNNT